MNRVMFEGSVALLYGILPEKNNKAKFIFKKTNSITRYFVVRAKQNTVTFYRADDWEKGPSHKKFYRYDLAFAYLQERLDATRSSKI